MAIDNLPACGVMTGDDIKNRVDLLVNQSNDPVKGNDALKAKIDSSEIVESVNSLKSLLNYTPGDGKKFDVTGFYDGTDVGGGVFRWDASKDKADHNGGTVIAPEALTAWDGTSGDIATLLDWTGAGSGCFVRLHDGLVKSNYFDYTNSEDLRLKLDSTNADDESISFGRTGGINSKTATEGVFDFANLAGQSNYGNEPIGFVFHHYTDGSMIQVDNVGEDNKILILKNAQNVNRRSDKANDFSGNGIYISFDWHDPVAGFNKTRMFIDNEANFTWTGVSGIAKFRQNKDNDGLSGFRLDCIKQHGTMLEVVNGSNAVLRFDNDVSYTRATIYSHTSQTSGMFLESKAGSVRIKSANNTVIIDGVIRANSGNTAISSNGGLVDIQSPLKIAQYSTAGLPSAASFSGCIVSISDKVGKPSPIVYSDGSDWLYMDNTPV